MREQEIPDSFGEWVKRRRKMLDLTQEELAKRANCSVFALRKIEADDRRPSKQLARLLAEALAIEPEKQQTFIRVARGELNLERLGMPSGLAYISAPGSIPASHYLPSLTIPLLGRQAELAALERLFKDSQCRLMTLTGLGGIGKTSLAIEFSSCHETDFPGGIYYVPLASVQSADSIVPAIAEVIGFSFSGPAEAKEQLINRIAVEVRQDALFVLDNLEHLLGEPPIGDNRQGGAEFVAELLQRLPKVKILVTSRERLNLQGEWTYELHGLPVPPHEYVEHLGDYGAVALFVQSAQRTKAGFEITDRERPALVRICQLLEGIPLAIELAAAWVGILSCSEIAREIEANIDFLATSMRDVPERHRSLRATFDHSWGLLSEAERGVLCRLSVFQGGFDREAASCIAGADLPLLASLVSKSLVWRTEDERYDLHEVIRQFARSHLSENPEKHSETRDRHAKYYLRLVAVREKDIKSAAQPKAVRELSMEIDNLRAAWDWSLERGDFSSMGMSVRCLGWFFEAGGLLREGIEHFEPLILNLRACPDSPELQRILGSTLAQQSLLYFRKGWFDDARSRLHQSLQILRPLGEPAVLTDPLIYLGVITHLDGDLDTSQALIEECLVCAQAGGDGWFEAYALYNLGYLASLRGNYEEARSEMLAGLAMWRRFGDPHSISLGLNFLTSTLLRLGQTGQARTFLEESIALSKQSGNRWGMGNAYRFMGLVDLAQGDNLQAQANFRKSLDIFSDYIVGWDIAISSTYLAEAILLAGDFGEARKIYLDAIRIAREANAVPILLDALAGFANLQILTGEATQAFVIAEHVLSHPASTREAKEIAERLIHESNSNHSDHQIPCISEDISSGSLEALVTGLLA